MTINRHYPVTRYPTTIPGLLYRPSIEPGYSDRADYIEPYHSLVTDRTTPDQYYSERNRRELTHCLQVQGLAEEGAMGLILEIGVAIVTDDRPFENTSTYVLTERKADSVMYYGMDIAKDKKVKSNLARGIRYFLGCDSNLQLFKHTHQFCPFKQWGIDLLHVDGNHSVKDVLNDWQYTQFLTPGGMAVFHDVNVHPGPPCVLDAVDPELFSVQAYFQDTPGDFGMATVMRRRFKP